MALKSSRPSIDENPLLVVRYALKSLFALGFIIEGVDLDTGMLIGYSGL
jgi:hypothetical protein